MKALCKAVPFCFQGENDRLTNRVKKDFACSLGKFSGSADYLSAIFIILSSKAP
jgi:hypothetical protein